MKLGFVSAILPDLSLEEVVEFAAQERFACVELMCWPEGKAERRYAGVTHIDVTDFGQAEAAPHPGPDGAGGRRDQRPGLLSQSARAGRRRSPRLHRAHQAR